MTDEEKYYDLKEYEEAIADFSKSLEFGLDFDETQYIYDELGNAYKAIGEIEKANFFLIPLDFEKAM